MTINLQKIHVNASETFPNSKFPVLLYKNILELPGLFPAKYVSDLFERNNWSNSWDAGIFDCHHYHSNVHEAMGVYKGSTTVMLGGEGGVEVTLEKGDVLIIPAGVAHKNMGSEHDISCVGAYPLGQDYDMMYGKPEEREQAADNLIKTPIPDTDPVRGGDGLPDIWKD
ncbi:cupin domain-containing protein [Mucilaginibacter antarcticus]|uniref:Cupin domain-containing protein n=1 Tax=Mucilaginibacter antarcticus TaxID=1855725 RepID=A0ABW5XJJ0_9SPHI